MKISREGVLLIKSFEGFRPRATRRDDGRWVVGYGHTASAREGATVSEADAELLLQYDLIPVQAALSERMTRPVNQHQYDALASFAFSVGQERFTASDVLARVNAGAEAEAADALAAWPEPLVRDAGLRRRVAERALFTADPTTAVTLSDLLTAPVPAPAFSPVAAPPSAAEAEPQVSGTSPQSAHEISPEAATALEGESAPPASDEVPIFAPTSVLANRSETAPVEATPVETAVAERRPVETILAETSTSPEALIASDVASEAEVIAVGTPAEARIDSFSPPHVDAEDIRTARDAAYSTPGLPSHPLAPGVVADPFAHVPDMTVAADPFTGAVAPAAPTVWPAPDEAAAQGELQVSGAAAEGAVLASPRLVWPNEERGEDSATRFDDQGRLDLSHQPAVWSDPFDAKAVGFSWRRVWAYLVMGGFGLVSLAMSMAALRKASLASTDVRSILAIAAVLAIIGAACVGVSAYNIYQRLSDDR